MKDTTDVYSIKIIVNDKISKRKHLTKHTK